MRLIDAEPFKAKLIYLANYMQDNGHATYASAVGEIISILDRRQTIDAVPVVRCRDCKHRGGYHCPMYHTETSFDDLDGFDEYNVDKTDGDGFCHRGERRE